MAREGGRGGREGGRKGGRVRTLEFLPEEDLKEGGVLEEQPLACSSYRATPSFH